MPYNSSMGSKDRRRRRETLWKRQNGKCANCGIDIKLEEATLDHIIPRSKGGGNSLKNLEVLCQPCNYEKRDLVDG